MKKQTAIEPRKLTTQLAGIFTDEIRRLLNLSEEDKEVVIYPGVIKHIKKRHLQAYKHYLRKIPEIITYPDYIGVSSESPKKIECVKCYKDYVLVALKYNDEGKLFVSSMYIIDYNRIEKRIGYGRLIDVTSLTRIRMHSKQHYKNKGYGTRK